MSLVVKRHHGLGDLLMLLPVLVKAVNLGHAVTLVTRAEWIEEIARWAPAIRCTTSASGVTHDLDLLTRYIAPWRHQSLEFAEALGIPGPFPALACMRPRYDGVLAHKYRRSIVYAPEAGHPARKWPASHLSEVACRLVGSPLVLIGIDRSQHYHADQDLRGRLSLGEMFEVVSSAKCVIAMDSGAMHVAMALDVPVVAVFGGIDPTYRVLLPQRVRVLIGSSACRPCNKNETCNGKYSCLREIRADDVIDAMHDIESISHREIRTPAVSPISNAVC